MTIHASKKWQSWIRWTIQPKPWVCRSLPLAVWWHRSSLFFSNLPTYRLPRQRMTYHSSNRSNLFFHKLSRFPTVWSFHCLPVLNFNGYSQTSSRCLLLLVRCYCACLAISVARAIQIPRLAPIVLALSVLVVCDVASVGFQLINLGSATLATQPHRNPGAGRLNPL
jgi:hypothetical protein